MRRHITMFMLVAAAMLAFIGPSTLAPQSIDMGSSPSAQRADRLERGVQRLVQALNLTDEQKAQITPLIADEIKQIQAVRADRSLGPGDRSAKIVDIRQTTNQQIRSLLTAEQQQKLDTLRQQARASPTADARARLQQLATQLNLTDDQKAQIEPILQHEFQQIQQVRADTSLTRRARFAKIRKIRKEANKEIWPLLTPDQQKTLEQIRQEGREKFRERNVRRGGGGPAPI